MPNTLLSSATIIGKVFEDVNVQNEATAKNIVIKNAINNSNYKSGTAEMILLDSNNKEISRSEISDADITALGIKVNRLDGKSLNNKLTK